MSEREKFIDRSILEIYYDFIQDVIKWRALCEFVESQPDLEWGKDILPAFRRLGLLRRYDKQIKSKVNPLEFEEVMKEFKKTILESSQSDFDTSDVKLMALYIRQEEDNEETWKKLKDYKDASFIRLKTVDIQQLLAYPQLERLHFQGIREVRNLHLLEEMPNLKKLIFDDVKKCTSDKEKISLNINDFSCSSPDAARCILHNSGMKRLSLDHMDTILDLKAIGSLETLEYLFLNRITKVVHPDALVRAKNLKYLQLYIIRPGDDWSVLKELPSLHTLEFNAEPSLKESFCEILLSHPWLVIDPNYGELDIAFLEFRETIQGIDLYEHKTDKRTTFCVFGDFSEQIRDKNNVTLEALVKQRIKQQKIKTKYVYDSEVGMFSVDAPTLEGAYQLIEILNEVLDT